MNLFCQSRAITELCTKFYFVFYFDLANPSLHGGAKSSFSQSRTELLVYLLISSSKIANN